MKRVSLAWLGVGIVTLLTTVASSQESTKAQAAVSAADKQELAKLEGDWEYVTNETKGVAAPVVAGRKITIKGDQWAIVFPRPGAAAAAPPLVSILKLKIDASQDPKTMDQSAASGSNRLGIYKLEGDALTACFSNPGDKERPKEFKSNADGGSLMVLKRTGTASAIPPPSAPATAAAPPPDMKAYADAMRLTDQEKKIEALQKFFVDHPTSARTDAVQTELIRTLIKAHRGEKEKLLPELDKLLAAAPETAKQNLLNTVAWELFLAGALLDEAEGFAAKSIALMDEQKFVEGQKRAAELRKASPPSDDELKKRFRASRAHVQDTLGQIYVKQGKTEAGEKLLKEAFDANPTMSATAVALADLAQQKGDEATAFDYLATAAVVGRAPPETKAKLEALFVKRHPGAAVGKNLEVLLDDRYRKLFPTLHVPAYQPTPERSNRAVLAEVFTGAACPPCVAADLAFDAMLERYARKDLVVLMYHLHIPGPDPLTNPSTQARSKFYGVRGVPSYVLDGELKSGGGSREMTQGFYDRVNPTVEQRLEAAAEARLDLVASLEGTTAKIKADVSEIKGDATDVKLQVALVEEMLSYSGENGIRLHPMVVRSLAGPDAGGFAVDVAKPATVEATFDITAITTELKAHLDDFEAKAPGGRKFSQKKDAIDPSNLSVVAFVQDQATKKILQAAYVRLASGDVAAGR